MSPAPQRISFTVKLAVDDHGFLKVLKSKRRLKVLGDSIRLLVSAARTLYTLPPYQAARVREDMEARGLDVVTYVQELLAKRYEALALDDEAKRRRAPSVALAAGAEQ